MLERFGAAIARGQEAEHGRQEGETALWHQRTQETLKATRDEVVRGRSTANRAVLRPAGRREGEGSGALAAKVRTFVLDQAADHRVAASFQHLPRDEPVRARRALSERVGASGAARRSVEWWSAGHDDSSLCFWVDGSVDVSKVSV